MKSVIAIVGMPGAGKSEAAGFFNEKGIEVLRFGLVTDEGLKSQNLDLNEENEKAFREKLRRELGMAAYAIKMEPKINNALEKKDVVVLDGLYSWEEYLYLSEKFPALIILCVYANPKIRYKRLETREIRPLSQNQARERDIAEISNVNKGGPIAIADYLVKNETTKENLHQDLENFLENLHEYSH